MSTLSLVHRVAGSRLLLFVSTAVIASACVGEASDDPAVSLQSVTPSRVSARGGTQLTLKGRAFTASTVVELAGARAKTLLVSSSELTVFVPPMWAGQAELSVRGGSGVTATFKGGLEVMPLELRFVEAPPHALSLEPTAPVSSVAARDFDGDGDVDFFACGGGAACRILTNDGRANFVGPLAIDAGPTDAADAGPMMSLDAGVPAAKPAPTLAALSAARVLGSDDLDGDSDFDVVLTTADGHTFVLPNTGEGRFLGGTEVMEALTTDAGTVPLKPVTAAVLADVDGDGKVDLVSAGATPSIGPFRVDLNTSTASQLSFTRWPGAESPPQPYVVTALALADLDGDKDLDVVLATTGGDGIALRLFVNRNAVFTEKPGGLPSSGGPYKALAVGDVTADGNVDVIAVGAGQDRLLVNDGSAHFFDASASLFPVDGSPGTSVALLDLDRDRDLDLVVANAGAATRLYVNDGSGKFVDRTPSLPIHTDNVTGLCAANLDGDGDQDLVVLTAVAAVTRLYLSVEPQ
jgi:hypothetical protein